MRRQLRKHETKDDTEHKTVRSNGGVRQRKRMTQVEEKRSHFLYRRTRHLVTMPSTPSPIDRPLGLVVHLGGGAAAAGKLSSHCRREAEGAGGALYIRNAVRRSTGRFWWKQWKWGCLSRSFRCGRNTGTATRSSRRSGNQGC